MRRVFYTAVIKGTDVYTYHEPNGVVRNTGGSETWKNYSTIVQPGENDRDAAWRDANEQIARYPNAAYIYSLTVTDVRNENPS